MRVIAMYLPQFHRVAENDEWWGKGFTEWTAVRAAEPLFDGHNQPRKPLDENYYDLLKKSTMQQQAALMKTYNIFGMCFYHYWFKDGRKILEKPAENLLRWKDIDMPFCFSWANESWTRTWSKFNDNTNAWSSIFEKGKTDETDNGILLEQKYGDEKSWYQHFMYLLPFFLDSRYIRIENKPVFVFYKPISITCLQTMILYWNQLACENGLEGIYFVGTNVCYTEELNAVIQQEPVYTINNDKIHATKDACRKQIECEEIWEKILDRRISSEENVFSGAFTGFDNTPRNGMRGTIITGANPKIFRNNLKKLLKKSFVRGSEYVFINAWNEWGEGMYLEPDEENGYAYLEAVKEALDTYQTENVDVKCNVKHNAEQIEILKEKEYRYESYWRVLDKWMVLKERYKGIADYLQKKKFHTVAIYGIGILGRHLITELENSEISVLYGIDQRKSEIQMKFPVYNMEDTLPEVDVIIVTAVHQFGKIYRNLQSKINCPVLSLEGVIDETI